MTNWTNTFTGNAVKPSAASYQALNIAVSTALAWPTETLEGVPYVAATIDVTATAGGLAVTMPDARNGANGVATMFTNVGANTFVVNDFTGVQIASIAAGVAYVIILRDNTTAAGLWRAVQLAATTSNANAAALAGPGLQASGSTLQTNDVNDILAVNTLLTTAHRGHIVTWTAAAGTLTLDTLAHLGVGWSCWIINEGTGVLTVATSGTDTINTGQASLALPPGTGGACPSLRISAAAGQFNASGATTVPTPPAAGGTGVVNDPTNSITFTGHFSLGLTLQQNSQITLPTSGTLAILGANVFTGKQQAPQLTTAGNLAAASWTTGGLRLALAAATMTDTSSAGVVAAVYGDAHKAVTFAASAGTTYSDASGCYFEAPVAGGNVTLTRAWALGADSILVNGVFKATGHLTVEGVTSTGATGTGKFVFDAGASLTAIAGAGFRDTSAAFDVTLGFTSSVTLTAGRTLTIDIANANRSLKISGTSVINQDVSTAGNAQFASVGLGMTPVNILDVTQNQNGQSIAQILNNSSGTAALSKWSLSNGTDGLSVTLFGTAFTASGVYRPHGGTIECNGSGGLTLNTAVNQPVYVGVNGTEVARFISTGIRFPNSATVLLHDGGGGGTGSTDTSLVLNVNGGVSAYIASGQSWNFVGGGAGGTTILSMGSNGAVTFNNVSTTAIAANAVLDSGNGNNFLRSTSSIFVKTNIRRFGTERSGPVVDMLSGVLYNSLCDADDPSNDHYGMIAEWGAKVAPELVHWIPTKQRDQTARVPDGYVSWAQYIAQNDRGGMIPDGWQYERVIPLLVEEVKQLRADRTIMQKQIASLSARPQ